MATLLLAVDGGQTSTEALLATLDGVLLGRGVAGACDHFHAPRGVERNRAAIQGAIRAAFADAARAPGAVAACALGLTGVTEPAMHAAEVERIVREVVPAERVVLTPDYVTNLAGAAYGQHGVVVIAGGGSIAYASSEDGRSALAGGFGYLYGDEGSAFDIGRQAVRAAARACDGRGVRTMLVELVERTLELAHMRELPRVAYAADFRRERIAALAPAVVAAAEAGDAVARDILDQAGRELATMALAAARQIYPSGARIAIYPTGGVFRAGPAIERPFATAVDEHWPAAQIRPPASAPVVGALILAALAAGKSVDGTWLQRIAGGLPPIGARHAGHD